MKFLETAKREPINLSCDGEQYRGDTPAETINILIMLRKLGYRFPDYVIERLKEEDARKEDK